MNPIMRDLPPVVSLLAAMLFFSPLAFAEQPDHSPYRFLLERFLRGDGDVEAELRNTPQAIPLLEDFLIHGERATASSEVEPLIEELAADEFIVREKASQQLFCQLPACESQLRATLVSTEDLEVRWRVERLLVQSKAKKHLESIAPLLLKNMYGRHLKTIWPEYFARFQADPTDRRALLLFQHTDPNFLLTLTADNIEPEERLKYLLALKYLGISEFDLYDRLEEFKSEQILDMAAKTYWPIELQPLRQDDGCYSLLRCGSVKDREVRNVLQISLDRDSPRAQIVHFNVWPRWIYLFRFEKPLEKTYDGVALTVNTSHEVISRLVPTIPADMKLTKVRLSRSEQFDWGVNMHYAWAKSLYPADLLDRVNFRSRPKEMSAAVVTEPKSK
jgi:hypothetical protein